jgi:tRNA G46 methylase TrmB
VGALLKRIGEQGLQNIRILQHDAVEVMNHMLAPQACQACTCSSQTPGTKPSTTSAA